MLTTDWTAEQHHVGVVDGLQHAWRGAGVSCAGRHDRRRGELRVQPDPPLLEVHVTPAAPVVDQHVRLDLVVRHRQQPDPGCHRRHSSSVTADSGWPSASSWLRRMCVAKSRSPRVNQSGPAP